MTILYFIRHAQSDYSVKDECMRPLTEKGLADAQQLPHLFTETTIDALYCSPYRRTIQTLAPLAKQVQQPIRILEDLRERSIGCWVEDFYDYSQQQWADFTYKLDNGESLAEVQTRNIQALTHILASHDGHTVVVGTHGTALSTILQHYDATFNFQRFLMMVNVMPYIMKLTFRQHEYLSSEEIPFSQQPDQ